MMRKLDKSLSIRGPTLERGTNNEPTSRPPANENEKTDMKTTWRKNATPTMVKKRVICTGEPPKEDGWLVTKVRNVGIGVVDTLIRPDVSLPHDAGSNPIVGSIIPTAFVGTEWTVSEKTVGSPIVTPGSITDECVEANGDER